MHKIKGRFYNFKLKSALIKSNVKDIQCQGITYEPGKEPAHMANSQLRDIPGKVSGLILQSNSVCKQHLTLIKHK